VFSRDGDFVDVLLAPRELPYLAEDVNLKQGWELFDIQLAKEAQLRVNFEGDNVVSCRRQEYRRGLLRKRFHKRTIKLVKLPTPDEIAWHGLSGIDETLVQRSFKLFSAQFWREGDKARVHTGELTGEPVTIVSVDLANESVTLLLSEGLWLERPLYDIRRVFTIGDSVRVITSRYHGYHGTVISKYEDTLTLYRNGLDDEVGAEPPWIRPLTILLDRCARGICRVIQSPTLKNAAIWGDRALARSRTLSGTDPAR
jgi:ribosomal protein L24